MSFKAVQLGLGVDYLGSKLSLVAGGKSSTLELWYPNDDESKAPLGVKAVSAKSGLVVYIPWANIKGIKGEMPAKEVDQAPAVKKPKKVQAE